jgi:hypothetical protein
MINNAFLKSLRLSNELELYVDFTQKVPRDQGNRGYTVTLPSTAIKNQQGVRVTDSPVVVSSLDMTSIDEFFVWFTLQGLQQGGASQYPLAFSSNPSGNTDAWACLFDSVGRCFGVYTNSAGGVEARTSNMNYGANIEVGFDISRKLSFQNIKPYTRGLLDVNGTVDQDNTDGSNFGVYDLNIGSLSGGGSPMGAVIQEVGIHKRRPV